MQYAMIHFSVFGERVSSLWDDRWKTKVCKTLAHVGFVLVRITWPTGDNQKSKGKRFGLSLGKSGYELQIAEERRCCGGGFMAEEEIHEWADGGGFPRLSALGTMNALRVYVLYYRVVVLTDLQQCSLTLDHKRRMYVSYILGLGDAT